jgi:hypothetical protein
MSKENTMSYEDRKLVSYRFGDVPRDEREVRFVDFADTPLPDWAVDVQPYEEDVQDEC